MVAQHVVVDGSNIATEGRTAPSLEQLDVAVSAFVEEHHGVRVTVVVDATFGHRIDPAEKPAYEEAVLAGELVSPPAGAIGRGDAFVLQIADKADASVLSNDSFQEFHGTYDWLFDEGRLIGGKPVPDVGWVFVLRTPVRGPASRRSTRGRTTRSTKATADTAPVIELVPSPPAEEATSTSPSRRRGRRGTKAIDASASADVEDGAARTATSSRASKSSTSSRSAGSSKATGSAEEDVAAGEASSSGGRRRRAPRSVTTVNEPVPFLAFVSAHPLGTSVEGTVDRFSSHGAYVTVGDADCYLPLKSMGDPPPKSAREVLSVGEVRSFVVEAFDSPRRSIDLAIPGFAKVDEGAAPSIEHEDPAPTPAPDLATEPAQEAPNMAVARKSTARKSAAKRSTAKKKATAKRAPAKKKATAKKATASGAKKAPARKKAAAKRAPAKKSTAKKAAAKKKSSAKKAPARKKATARKATARKRSA